MTDAEKQGYEADHVDIKLLRLKNFTLGRKLEDSEITGADSLRRIADLIGSMVPFVSFCLLRLLTFCMHLQTTDNLNQIANTCCVGLDLTSE